MDMDRITELALQAGLRELASKNYFSISTLDSLIALVGASCKGSRAYTLLHTLHCVDYGKMHPDLRAALPELIGECLGQQAPKFEYPRPPSFVESIEIRQTPKPKSAGFLSWLS